MNPDSLFPPGSRFVDRPSAVRAPNGLTVPRPDNVPQVPSILDGTPHLVALEVESIRELSAGQQLFMALQVKEAYMSPKPFIGKKRPFSLVVEQPESCRGTRKRFDASRGEDAVTTALGEAGITEGEWHLRLLSPLQAGPHTPDFQARNFDAHGVMLWLKPGGNDSGVKAILKVSKDSGRTPEDVYEQLRKTFPPVKLEKRPKPTKAEEKTQTLDEGTATALLEAVRHVGVVELVAAGTLSTFLGHVAARVSLTHEDEWPEPTPGDIHGLLQQLTGGGLVQNCRTHYAITAAGQANLTEAGLGEVEIEEAAPARVELQDDRRISATAVPAPASTTSDLLAAISAAKERMERLLRIPEVLAGLQSRRAEVEKEIESLMRELDEISAKETELVRGVDVDALRCLAL